MESRNDASVSVEQRLSALEARLAHLEKHLSSSPDSSGILEQRDTNHEPTTSPEPAGDVFFGGDVSFSGRTYQYRWQRPAQFLVDRAWDDAFTRLESLAHPARGKLLRHLLTTPASVSELVATGVVSSTGTAYHHLNALTAGGWIAKDADFRFFVRPSRVIALLTLVSAGEDH